MASTSRAGAERGARTSGKLDDHDEDDEAEGESVSEEDSSPKSSAKPRHPGTGNVDGRARSKAQVRLRKDGT